MVKACGVGLDSGAFLPMSCLGSGLEPRSPLSCLPSRRSVNAGADLVGFPSADGRVGCVALFASLSTEFSLRKLSPVGDWKRRTTVNSRAVFSYALRMCLASLPCVPPPTLGAPFIMGPRAVSYAPVRELAAAMKAGSIADGDADTPCGSGGDVFSVAVRCNQSFCCVRDGGSVPD